MCSMPFETLLTAKKVEYGISIALHSIGMRVAGAGFTTSKGVYRNYTRYGIKISFDRELAKQA